MLQMCCTICGQVDLAAGRGPGVTTALHSSTRYCGPTAMDLVGLAQLEYAVAGDRHSRP